MTYKNELIKRIYILKLKKELFSQGTVRIPMLRAYRRKIFVAK